MSEFLMRGNVPLSVEEWQHIDEVVVNVARQYLVGRRFIELAGPFGAGMETIPVGMTPTRQRLPLAVIEQPFTLHWRDIEANRKLGVPIELGAAAMASAACAKQEDQMIFDAMLQAAPYSVQLGDWETGENPFATVVAATEKLVANDFYGPYAVILSPSLYSQTQRVVHGMGRMVRKLIADVAEGGIFRSPLLAQDQGLVLSLGHFNFDLVIGQDLVTAYTGNEGLDHNFLIMESLALRIKRAGAICKLVK